jgi:hypothetical protein
MSDLKTEARLTPTRLSVAIALLALLAGSLLTALAATAPRATTRSRNPVETLALHWFVRMQTGQIDRSQLAAEYNVQLTDAAVRGMANYLKQHDYGAPPQSAEVMRTRTIGDQTFYEVKLIFPRGDAASLLFGFDAARKITGVSLLSMAGD